MEACYRHPGRETGVACSNCDRPICPDCMTSTPVGMRCPECAKQRTQARTLGAAASEPTLTYVLIAINVLVGLGLMAGGGSELEPNTIYREGALSGFAIADGEYWRLVTSGFVHGSGYPSSVLLHLLFNMLIVWIIGSELELEIGRLRFGLIYFVSLLSGSFGVLLLESNATTAGASGAAFGLMAAAIIIMRHRGINPMESGIVFWLGLNLVITFTFPNISIGGHIGGLLGGGLTAFLMFDLRDRLRLPDRAVTLACVALGAVAVVGSVVVAGP